MTAEFLVQGILWADSIPFLNVVHVETKEAHLRPLLAEYLGMQIVGSTTFCLGRYAFQSGTDIQLVPCPRQAPVASGNQCDLCAQRDEFRYAHHFHKGGYAPSSLLAYMSQPHWVYIATFADATSKVGTAAQTRKKTRLDEQGATIATYVARTPDGRMARVLEDELSASLSLAQTKRRSAKVSALLRPALAGEIGTAHRETVRRAATCLSTTIPPSDSTQPLDERWDPPSAYGPFLETGPKPTWTLYPHPINTGQHGLYVDACAGTVLLARTGAATDCPPHVIDIGSLTGTRILFGNHSSPGATVQTALF